MSNTLVIRADANMRMGTGHVMRCIALGQAWQDAGGTVSFVSCCDSDGIKKRIQEEGFGLIELSGVYPQSEEDISTLLNVATQTDAQWVVVDGYQFDLTYQQAIRRSGCKLLYVDDCNHLLEYEADILLNQNLSAGKLNYCCNTECIKKIGVGHILLRREFWSVEARSSVVSPVRHLLISLGGSDPDNATSKLLAALPMRDYSGLHVRVLVGPSNPHLGDIRSVVKRLVAKVEILTDVKDMPDLIQWADFAISAAGSTTWELAAAGIPFATVVVAENQEGIAAELDIQCGCPSLGWVNSGFGARVANLIEAVVAGNLDLERCRHNLVSLVDPLSVKRLVREMLLAYEN